MQKPIAKTRATSADVISSIVFASLILGTVTVVKNRGADKPREAAHGTHREPRGGSRRHKR